MSNSLLQSLRDLIQTKPNDSHAHRELAALIRRQAPEVKSEVDAIMNERYKPSTPQSTTKTWIHPSLRGGKTEKKNTSGAEVEAAEAVNRVVVGSEQLIPANDPPIHVAEVSHIKVMNQSKPVEVRPTTEIDPAVVVDMDFEAFTDFFKTSKAMKSYALAIGVEKPSADPMAMFDQIKAQLQK